MLLPPACPTPRLQWGGVNGARGYLSPVHGHYVFHAVCDVSSLCLEIMLLLFLLMRLLSRTARGIPDTGPHKRACLHVASRETAIRVKDPRDPGDGSAKSRMLVATLEDRRCSSNLFRLTLPSPRLNSKWSGSHFNFSSRVLAFRFLEFTLRWSLRWVEFEMMRRGASLLSSFIR